MEILCNWLEKSKNIVTSFLKEISVYSLDIYLIHPLIISVLIINIKWFETVFTRSAFANYTIDFILRYCVVLAVSYGTSKAINFINSKVVKSGTN